MSRVSHIKQPKRSPWTVREGMRLVQVQLPKDIFIRFKLEAVKREKSFSDVLSAYLAQTSAAFDFGELVIVEGSADADGVRS